MQDFLRKADLLFHQYGQQGQTTPLYDFDPLLKKHAKKAEVQHFIQLNGIVKVIALMEKHFDN